MKLQLNEKTLNAYINRALNEELDELLGGRVRKQSQRMITGKGWGNQRADKGRNDISQTDANEECPQTLVGMVSKLEQILVAVENSLGIQSTNQNLAGNIAATGVFGGFKMKKSLVNAINALTTIGNRINTVERKTGMNKIMESSIIKEDGDALTAGLVGGAVGSGGAKAASGGLKTALGKIGGALGSAGEWAVTGVGGKAGAVGVLTSPAAIAAAAFAIAQAASVAAAKGRQRNIVRTYNCAAVLAKRLGNIAKQLQQQQPTGNTQVVQEINVRRGMKSFDSIESGMQELSGLVQQLVGGGQKAVQIPQGIDLNTREGVLAFQQWANSIPVTDANGNALREDGIFGTNTSFVYDKIAQMLQRRGQTNRGLVKESKAVETALANLERVAGTTGSGGNAYASIGAMSGGENASRLQNAQNIKNIIRTYPPVLNQYLNTLADAGADVSALQPLNVDTRPHRNYSVKELQAIDTRIQQLLQIARGIEVPEGQNGGNVIIGGTLPPKPVRNPNPPVRGGVRTPQMPELGDVDIEDQDIQVDDVSLPTMDEPTIDKMGYRNRRTGEHGSYEYVDDAISQMRGFARGNTVGVREKMSDINKIYSQAKHAIDTAVQNGDWTAQQARERRQKLNDYYKEVKRIAKSS